MIKTIHMENLKRIINSQNSPRTSKNYSKVARLKVNIQITNLPIFYKE